MFQCKYENWEDLVRECKDSGLDAATWCRENQISYSTYRSWLGELRQEPKSKETQWAALCP